MFNLGNPILCWSIREKELEKILIKLIVSLMKTSLNSSIPCQEQWMLSIQECPHLVANKSKRKTSISTSSLLKREVSLELQTLITMPIQRRLWKPKLSILKESRFRDQVQLSNRAMIISIRRPPPMPTKKVESKFLLTSKSRANGPSVKPHRLMECMSSRSPISSLIRMRWVQN